MVTIFQYMNGALCQRSESKWILCCKSVQSVDGGHISVEEWSDVSEESITVDIML